MERIVSILREAWLWAEHLHTAFWLLGIAGVGGLGGLVALLRRRLGLDEKLDEIPFDYLPDSPLNHGWVLPKEDRQGSAPAFSGLPLTAPVRQGLSIKPTGWYGLDYSIVVAHTTSCNRIQFSANFANDGCFYTLVEIRSKNGQVAEQRWIKHLLGNGSASLEGKEGVAPITGRSLGNGWVSFKLSLADEVRRAFGQTGLEYGRSGKLLKIRLRGSLSISPIELYKR